ncbi:flagellin N-terminal helical domain-containing protein [Caproiciproducens faecalis]|uniref:Flagellin n=1 Tax=Caproiciproducens faecalis TaxID=2820301 RepID=A0ABS7DQH2_9FIRM|nr:flagellin [Caproiciproducens faecalis]MBW7573065.1 flagellin [Caproiciproducens faecalis]
MVIQHNLSALFVLRQISINQALCDKSIRRLSSGYRINSAADDPAGLAVSEKMRAQIRGLQAAQQNTQDGISLVQTAEGNLNETQSILNRMMELAVQSSNGTYQNDTDRKNSSKEFESLKQEIDRIANTTDFNGTKLLNGSLAEITDPASPEYGKGGITLQVGADNSKDGQYTIHIPNLGIQGLGLDGTSIATQEGAQKAVDLIKKAADTVAGARGSLGAAQNGLERQLSCLSTMEDNLTAAESRIRDVDMAREMMELAQHNILVQAGMAMLAQANLQPQRILKLLEDSLPKNNRD